MTKKPWNIVTAIELDGDWFRPEPRFGAWFEVRDPEPSGTVGFLMMPMNEDGSPDVANVSEIEVAYGDA